MTKTTRFLLASTVLPALMLALPTHIAAAERENTIVIAQQPPQDTNPEHKKDPVKPVPPGQRPAQPPPAAQQPPKPPQQPTAQQPVAPTPPAAQQPVKPPPHPTAQQPVAPAQPPAALQHPAQPSQHPTAQQPVSPALPPAALQKPAQQPVSPALPPAALQHPVQPPQHPTAQQQPVSPAQLPTALQKPAQQPQQPTAQQPVSPAQPPTALQNPAQQPQRPAALQPSGPAQLHPGQPQTTVEVPRDHKQVLEHQQHAEEWRTRRVQDLREQRHEVVENGRTVIREPGRTIIVDNGRPFIRHNESDRFGFGARDVQVQQRGGETFTIVERPGGVRIVTVVDADGRLLRRMRRDRDGREIILIDNSFGDPGRVDGFYLDLAPPVVRIPRERYIVEAALADEGAIYEALTAPSVDRIERRYTLDEVRFNQRLLERMPRVDIDTITFETGSWIVTPEQAGRLSMIAQAINRAITRNPQEVFLIEGHTDAVGTDVDNLSLSDRRAEAVAAVLTEQFQVAPENMTTQGYGKQYLKIPTDGPERRNRRVTVRRITPLLMGQNAPQAN